ncbi:MAG: DMT family transporter [Bacteroidota bacterium]
MKNNISTDKNPTLASWLLLLLLALVWGSSYILIKRGLVAFQPQQLAGLRVTISALAFLPVLIWRFRQIDWSKWRYLAVVGFTGNFFPAFLFAYAQTELNSSTTGVLSSLTPLFTLVIGVVFFNVVGKWTKILGVMIGLAGAVFLILFGKKAGLDGNLAYGGLVILGTLMYSLSVNTTKYYLQDVDALLISVASFAFISIPGAVYLFSTDFVSVLQEHEQAWSCLGYIALLALFGTVAASVLFYQLVQMTSAIFASTVSYLIPAIALLWGAADGEPITSLHLAGMTAILLGVYIASR